MKLSLVLVSVVSAFAGSTPAEQGRAIFRSNCAFCHGADGRGGRGPNLTSRELTHGATDGDLKRAIREGIPGSTMPAFSGFEDAELDRLVAYLRLLRGSAPSDESVKGDAARGRSVYANNGCAACHRIGESGSDWGPDLTRIGSARPLDYLRESVTKPSADIPEAYEGVTAVLADGRKLRAMRVNEDTFSLQLRDQQMRYHLFQKSELREIRYDQDSLMPAYRLSAQDLEGLIAYLASLRSAAAGGERRQAEGIR